MRRRELISGISVIAISFSLATRAEPSPRRIAVIGTMDPLREMHEASNCLFGATTEQEKREAMVGIARLSNAVPRLTDCYQRRPGDVVKRLRLAADKRKVMLFFCTSPAPAKRRSIDWRAKYLRA